MEYINGWLGFVIDIVVTVVFCGVGVVNDGIIFLGVGLVLTGVGMVMLVRGDPTGGIVGSAGSVLSAPTGLICPSGCLQGRDKLRNAALATAAGPGSGPVEEPGEEKGGGPESPAGSDGTPATEEAPAATAETPLAAYGFVDVRGWAWTLVVVGLALLLFALYHGTKIIRGTMLSLTVGLFWLIQTQQCLGRYVCILYRDHLECIYSPRKADLVSIPYASIREARYSRYRLRLLLASGDRTTKFNVYFTLLASDKRDEARAVLRDKMRELGVLRED